MPSPTVPDLLLEHLDRLGVTRGSLAESFPGTPGLSKSSVYDILAGRRATTSAQLGAIADALDLDEADKVRLLDASFRDHHTPRQEDQL